MLRGGGEMSFLLPAKNLFCADIENAGIEIDSYNLYNFGLDTEGNCWYLDTCAPWYKYRQEPIRLLFDEDLLRGKIDILEDEKQRSEMNHFLDKILELFKSTRKSIEG